MSLSFQDGLLRYPQILLASSRTRLCASVSVGSRYFPSPVVVKAVSVISLDGLVAMHFVEAVGCRLVLHDIDGIGR